jgi:hypothetical protein
MPQTTFNVAASGDDGIVQRVGASYPPTGAYTVSTTGGDFEGLALKSLVAGPEYRVLVGLVRWDTSSLPADATVTAASFRWWQVAKASADTRSLAAEWYAGSNWPIDEADWTSTVGTDAHAGTLINDFITNADNDIVLTNLSNVSKTGYTGLRLHVTGATPSGENYLAYSPFDGTFTEPRLIVDYTVGAQPYIRRPALVI